jgi:hypothetical protein
MVNTQVCPRCTKKLSPVSSLFILFYLFFSFLVFSLGFSEVRSTANPPPTLVSSSSSIADLCSTIHRPSPSTLHAPMCRRSFWFSIAYLFHHSSSGFFCIQPFWSTNNSRSGHEPKKYCSWMALYLTSCLRWCLLRYCTSIFY